MSSLTTELNRFCSCSKRLQTILDDTKRCFDDINESGSNEAGQLFTAELLYEEEQEVLSTAKKPPGIIVFGQNAHCKTKIVNSLFSSNIFPNFDNVDNNGNYRMVQFKYGSNLTLGLSLPDGYDLAENLEAYNMQWTTIPIRDMEIKTGINSNRAEDGAVLEVSFNHSMLRQGVRVVVTPTCCDNGQELAVTYKKCCEKLSPIIVYAFETESLTSNIFGSKTRRPYGIVHHRSPSNVLCLQRILVICTPEQRLLVKYVVPILANCFFLELKRIVEYSRMNTLMPVFEWIFGIQIFGSQHYLCNNTCDMTVLENLRTTSHYQPVCFVRINPTVSSLANGDISQSPQETLNRNIGATDVRHYTMKNNNNNDVLSDLMQGATPGSLYQRKMTNFDEPEYNVSPPNSYLSSPSICRDKKEISVISFSSTVFQQLCAIGYLSESPDSRNLANTMTSDYYEVDSELVDRFENFSDRFVYFVQQTVQRYLVNSATVLNNCHERCLNMFIVSAFDMARDMMITPKKLEFARDKEQDLFKSLMKISVEKSDEIKTMISDTIHDIHDSLVKKAEEYEFLGVEFSDSGEIKTPKGLKICTYQIQEVVLGALNQAIAGNLVRSVDVLRDSYTGTLSRCLESLERFDKEQQRNEKSTSEALKQILNAAYQVEISLQSSSSLIRVLLERMKQLVKAMPWSTQPRIDTEWKRKAACDILANLSEARLAKNISSQIKERLNRSHDAFSGALRQLEQKHTGRLDKIEEERLKLRKVHAPRVAKMALESTSLKDVILHGMPQMSREIGRGQYGVVYSCDSWAGFSPCAIKSVVPPDDKHWNDLALEFYYTKNIPEHDRIVALRGSVIDYMYGGGSTPAVLLIMDRLQKDLYTAIKQGINWTSRVQVSIDVVEGIRFLHNQGLVHRDIKLKNVLIDKENRGKLTDLGFCKPEAMMSGSIVGTPIHMAPELFSGRYDNSVDVYAFGILFWYVCAGHVKLPSAFERCDNKDHLWTSVKKGLRPERLTTFDLECWNLMQECWEGEPFKRPLLGDVETRLKAIYEQYMKQPKPLSNSSSRSRKISTNRTKTPP